MIPRTLEKSLNQRLSEVPAVVLTGPRQVGKTTLALSVGESRGALYLDLESERDRSKLAEPELYLSNRFETLTILDEVHRVPGLFPIIRGLIDRARRNGYRRGLYLLLGSAALDLLKQSGETLAGRVSFLELHPFSILETASEIRDLDRLWLRGGFPDAFLSDSDAESMRWREDFIRTYLERDIPQFGPRIAAETLRRFWTMLAHLEGTNLNTAQLARNIGIDTKTAGSYVDLLVDLLLVRRLPSWHANVGKRIVKSPKIFIRDTGILHALLGVDDIDNLLSHPIVGRSWEGFIIENLLTAAADGAQAYFYRTSGGAEVDLLLVWPGGEKWVIEVKRSLAPKLERGFHSACKDLGPERMFVVYPGDDSYPLTKEVSVVPPFEIMRIVRDYRPRFGTGEDSRR